MLLDAFGLPEVGLDICLCVIGEGLLSPGEVAEILEYDRSTVSQYLNELAEIGLLEKARLNREGGAASLIEEANVTKEQYVEGDYTVGQKY